MKLWLLLAGAFMVQEPVSTGAVLLGAYRAHYDPWLIHLLFAAVTAFDVIATYYLGRYFDRRFGRAGMVARMKGQVEKFSAFIGERGKAVALVVYAPIIFPLSGLFMPWLDIPLGEALIFVLIGEIIFWYVPEWFLVLGVKTFFTNPVTGIAVIFAITVLLILVPRYLSKRK